MYITKLYKKKGNTITILDQNIHSVPSIKADINLSIMYYLEICPGDGEPCVNINLSHLLVETMAGMCNTWSEILALLSPIVLMSYKTIVPNLENPEKAVRSISPLSSDDFELSYLDYDVPEDRNVKQFRYRLTDLGIKKTNNDSPFNLENCLCFVNGLTSKPMMFNDELLMKDGAKFMASTTQLKHPSTVLLDFTELGGFIIVPFSDCQVVYKNYTNYPDPDVDIKLIFPEGIDLSEYTIFPVVGHSLFFPTDIQIVSKRSVVLNPGSCRVGMSLLKRAAASSNTLTNTYILQSDTTIKDYVLDRMFDPQHHGAFFVLIKSKDIWIHQTMTYNYHKSVEAGLNLDGILFDTTTQSILDYTKVNYDSVNDIYHHPLHGILQLDSQKDIDAQLALASCKCMHQDSLRDFGKGAFYFLKIIGL